MWRALSFDVGFHYIFYIIGPRLIALIEGDGNIFVQLIRGMSSPKRTGVDGGELYKLYLSWILFSVSPLVIERVILLYYISKWSDNDWRGLNIQFSHHFMHNVLNPV